MCVDGGENPFDSLLKTTPTANLRCLALRRTRAMLFQSPFRLTPRLSRLYRGRSLTFPQPIGPMIICCHRVVSNNSVTRPPSNCCPQQLIYRSLYRWRHRLTSYVVEMCCLRKILLTSSNKIKKVGIFVGIGTKKFR